MRHKTNSTKTYQKINKNEMIITLEQYEILDGLMLGDGCIQYSSKESKYPRLCILRATSDKEYMLWQYSKLENLFRSGVKEHSTYDKRTNKTYHRVYLQSRTSIQLEAIKNRWYKDKIKIVPRLTYPN